MRYVVTRSPFSHRYWFGQLSCLWEKILERLEEHIRLIRTRVTGTTLLTFVTLHFKSVEPGKLSPYAYTLIGVSPMTRNYVDLVIAVFTLGRTTPQLSAFYFLHNLSLYLDFDSRVSDAMKRMLTEFEAACYRLSRALQVERLRLVCLINNHSHVISALSVSCPLNTLPGTEHVVKSSSVLIRTGE